MKREWFWPVFVPCILLLGTAFAYRLLHIPTRAETAVFCIGLFLVPTLKWPKAGVYYLFCLPLFIPLFRRMYYLVSARPDLDYLMLISDGVMGGLIAALVLLWLLNKERSKDPLSVLIVAYTLLLFIKVFVGSQLGIQESLYGFKFNGLYVFFYFAGSYVLTTFRDTLRVFAWASWLLFLTALYGIKQILFGFTAFEQRWIDSITFTTLRIDGIVRPFSTYVSPAAMSDGMVLMLVLGAFWFLGKNRFNKPFGLLLAAACVAPLLIASVRTNWLAAAAGMFFYLVFLRLAKKWIRVSLIFAMALAIAGYAVKGDNEGDAPRGAARTHYVPKSRDLAESMIKNRTAALANPLQEYSVQKRMETWKGIFYASFFYPLGKGQGTTGYAHSYYFLVLGEIGYPGLLCFLAILFVAFRRGLYIASRARDEALRELGRMLVAVLFMISVLNLTGTHLHTPPGDIFFWFSVGCISRFYRETRDSPAPASGADSAGPDAPAPATVSASAGAPPALSMPGGAHA
jgi:O-antigen ligase